MTSLITGGSGFLGPVLAQKLIAAGGRVRVYDLQRSSRLPAEVEFVPGDVRDAGQVAAAMVGCKTVYHLATLMPQAHASRAVMQAVNVGGTENVLRAAGGAGVKRVVYLSSSEVYGRPHKVPMPEDHPLAPVGEYGRNKVTGEKLCRDYRAKTGIEAVILRPTTLVGPWMTEPTFLRSLKLARSAPFFCLGRGDNRFQMVDVGDVAEACVIAATKPGIDGEAFNLGSEGTLPFKAQLEELAKYLGREPKVHAIPVGLFKAALRLLHLVGRSPLEPDHFLLADSDFVLAITKAKEKLGWTPTKTNLEMIIETYEWYAKTH
jgi:dTDP-glucose 4,6-dehydratase